MPVFSVTAVSLWILQSSPASTNFSFPFFFFFFFSFLFSSFLLVFCWFFQCLSPFTSHPFSAKKRSHQQNRKYHRTPDRLLLAIIVTNHSRAYSGSTVESYASHMRTGLRTVEGFAACVISIVLTSSIHPEISVASPITLKILDNI